MTGTFAVRGTEFFQRRGSIFQKTFNFEGGLALIEKVTSYPNFLNLSFLEEIVNMPESFFLFAQVAFYSSLEAIFGPSYIKIYSLPKVGQGSITD